MPCAQLDCAELAAKLAQRLGEADAASDLAAVREARKRAAREMLRSLVPLLVQAAQAGVMHGDIKLENIMVVSVGGNVGGKRRQRATRAGSGKVRGRFGRARGWQEAGTAREAICLGRSP